MLKPVAAPFLVLLAAQTLLFGSSSSGFVVGNAHEPLPTGIPQHVACLSFEGPQPASLTVTNEFCVGILNLGFEVVDRKHLEQIGNELKLQHSGFISSDTAKELGKQLGADALFVGSVMSEKNQTSINAQLVNVLDGKVIWSANAESALELLGILRKDLRNLSLDLPSAARNDVAIHHLRNFTSGQRIILSTTDGAIRAGEFVSAGESRLYFRPDKGEFSTLLIDYKDVKAAEYEK